MGSNTGRFRLSDFGPAPALRESTSTHLNSPSRRPEKPAPPVLTTPAQATRNHLPYSLQPSVPTSRKRRAENDENSNTSATFPDDTPCKKRAYRPRRTKAEKLDAICDVITDVNWSLGDFLYELFRIKDDIGTNITRNRKQAMFSTNFLQGRTTYTAGMIVELWFASSDGLVSAKSSMLPVPMYSLNPHFASIKPARASLSAFAAQTIKNKVIKEAMKAVKPSSGLHATSRKRGHHKIEWTDIGTTTLDSVELTDHVSL